MDSMFDQQFSNVYASQAVKKSPVKKGSVASYMQPTATRQNKVQATIGYALHEMVQDQRPKTGKAKKKKPADNGIVFPSNNFSITASSPSKNVKFEAAQQTNTTVTIAKVVGNT